MIPNHWFFKIKENFWRKNHQKWIRIRSHEKCYRKLKREKKQAKSLYEKLQSIDKFSLRNRDLWPKMYHKWLLCSTQQLCCVTITLFYYFVQNFLFKTLKPLFFKWIHIKHVKHSIERNWLTNLSSRGETLNESPEIVIIVISKVTMTAFILRFWS